VTQPNDAPPVNTGNQVLAAAFMTKRPQLIELWMTQVLRDFDEGRFSRETLVRLCDACKWTNAHQTMEALLKEHYQSIQGALNSASLLSAVQLAGWNGEIPEETDERAAWVKDMRAYVKGHEENE